MTMHEAPRPVAVIGAALDLGAGRRGVDMGPSAIRYAGLEPRIEELGRRCVDWGDVVTAVAEASAVGDERVAVGAVAQRALAVPAALGAVVAAAPEGLQVAQRVVADEDDRASATAAPREWRGPESNRRHHGFQPCALPTELPRPGGATV